MLAFVLGLRRHRDAEVVGRCPVPRLAWAFASCTPCSLISPSTALPSSPPSNSRTSHKIAVDELCKVSRLVNPIHGHDRSGMPGAPRRQSACRRRRGIRSQGIGKSARHRSPRTTPSTRSIRQTLSDWMFDEVEMGPYGARICVQASTKVSFRVNRSHVSELT